MKGLYVATLEQCTNLSLAAIVQEYQVLTSHYKQPARHYHNLKHIEAMLKHFQQYQDKHKARLLGVSQADDSEQNINSEKNIKEDSKLAILLAIFYHDIIYDVNNTDAQSNEQKSADFFTNALGKQVSASLLAKVRGLILATEGHQIPEQERLAQYSLDSFEVALFLDLDLSILGQSSSIYEMYATAIRQEYAHVSAVDYRQGRSTVLQKFLERKCLYFTKTFWQRYEQQARDNIAQEIISLQK